MDDEQLQQAQDDVNSKQCWHVCIHVWWTTLDLRFMLMFSPQAHSQLRKGLGMRLANINSKTMRWHVCTCMYVYMGEE